MGMKKLARNRFEALAGYSRRPETIAISEEVEWYSDDSERVLGVIVWDFSDSDFGGIVLGRDQRRRFRAVSMSDFCDSRDFARQLLMEELERWSKMPDSEFQQGDEKGTPLDTFAPVVPAHRLSETFVRVATIEGFSPARDLIEAMMPFYEDVDGNFVEQFQTTAFDARFWELYLFALLNEQGFRFNRSFKAPDFFCQRFLDSIFVEAVTVNPTTNAAGLIIEPEVPTDKMGFKAYYQEYMPLKWGSPLTSKLKKRYWELEHVKGKPIVFAIQDFHIPRAMTFSGHSITSYLYGIDFTALFDETGKLMVKSSQRPLHKWGDKTIESGFFNLPDSQNVSAVVTNPTATISKFNRMAYLAGFGSRSVKMISFGLCYDHDPNAAVPRKFVFEVNDPKYSENWAQGANVYHNAGAIHQLDSSFLPDAAHHWFEEGIFRSVVPDFHPFQSQTAIATPQRIKRGK
jgi:hypothetical protein